MPEAITDGNRRLFFLDADSYCESVFVEVGVGLVREIHDIAVRARVEMIGAVFQTYNRLGKEETLHRLAGNRPALAPAAPAVIDGRRRGVDDTASLHVLAPFPLLSAAAQLGDVFLKRERRNLEGLGQSRIDERRAYEIAHRELVPDGQDPDVDQVGGSGRYQMNA